MTSLTGVHHVALTVGDLDRSERWYCEVLGFEVRFREDGDGRRALVCGLHGTGPVLGLVEHGGPGEGAFDPTTTGLDHVAFTVPTRADLDQWADRFSAHGIEHSGVVDVPPGAILNLKDPDGIAVALFWDR